MYEMILKDLNACDPLNYIKTKKLLGNLNYHIKVSLKKNDLKALAVTAKAIQDYISANKFKFDKEANSYRAKAYFAELRQMESKCRI